MLRARIVRSITGLNLDLYERSVAALRAFEHEVL